MGKYINITQQLVNEACVIHHLADTKPWKKTRKPGRVYDYFDVCYEVNEGPALKKYESFMEN